MNKNLRKWLVAKVKNTFNIFGWVKLALVNYDKKPPIYEKMNNKGLKVHIGSGEINIQGWINIDARDFAHVHIIDKEINLAEFTDNSIQEIYLCHILEHVSFAELEKILKLIYLKLQVGGLVRLSVPDFDKILSIYHAEDNNIDRVKHILMGGQDYEFNFHKSVYTKTFLSKTLMKNRFIDVSEWDTLSDFGVSLGDWSNGQVKTKNGKMLVSLNLKAIKGV